jgi:hypothetical protein
MYSDVEGLCFLGQKNCGSFVYMENCHEKIDNSLLLIITDLKPNLSLKAELVMT